MFFVSVRFTSQYFFGFMASYLNIVTLVPDCPVLGSFRASLFTFAPVHGFRPFEGQHHVHDLGGAQTHVLLGGAFTQQVLAFVTPSVDFKDGSFTKRFVGHDLGFS